MTTGVKRDEKRGLGAGVTGMTGLTGMIWMTEIKPWLS